MDVTKLANGRFRELHWVVKTGSTNADLAAAVLVDPSKPQVLFTDEQTAGRGRNQRSWTMRPGGGIMVSFFVPWREPDQAHAVNTALAVAVTNAVREVAGVSVALKWPNDVVVEVEGEPMKKLGGILAEVVTDSSGMLGVVAGLGLNVSWPTRADIADFPDDLAMAISLDEIAGQPTSRESLAAKIVARFDGELDRLDNDGVAALHASYEQRCATLGRTVSVKLRGETLQGTATALDPSGALVVNVDGEPRLIVAGDVVHLRDVASH